MIAKIADGNYKYKFPNSVETVSLVKKSNKSSNEIDSFPTRLSHKKQLNL